MQRDADDGTSMMTTALRELGVRKNTLTDEEKTALDRDGYLVVPGVLTPQRAAQLAARLEDLAAQEGAEAGRDFQVEPGATRLGTLINKDRHFDVCFLHPKALAAVAHIMGHDFGLSSITARAAPPGTGHQAFHRDSSEDSANVLWMMSDFTPHNGPTRLVPGSHRFAGHPRELLEDPAAPHPDEIHVTGTAGTMVVINGYTWHSGTRNHTDRPRHLVSAFWTQRGRYQPESHRTLTPQSQARLSTAARYVIDHTGI